MADSYDWLYGRLLECKEKQKKYEEGWDAVRKFDEDLGAAQAMFVRGQGVYHAFRRQLFETSFKSVVKSMWKSKGDGDKAKAPKAPNADMDAMRGLLAEMWRCKTRACV